MKTAIRKLVVYAVMITFILGLIIAVGTLGHALTAGNAAWIVATGLALAYVVDDRLKKVMEGVNGV
jgi:hypothetical protein